MGHLSLEVQHSATLHIATQRDPCVTCACNRSSKAASSPLGSCIAVVVQAWRVQVAALEFSRDRKMMSVLCRQGTGCTLFCKGAPEALLLRCTQACPPVACRQAAGAQ